MVKSSAPVRPRLSRDRVLEAAVDLADREGVQALTLRRLADVLAVHPTSLYNHVASKDAILDGVVERLFAQADLPAEADSWQQWVRGVAAGLRALARAHPGAFLVLTGRAAENQAAYRIAESGLTAFQRDGFSLVQSVHAVRAVSLAALGLALDECPPVGEWHEPTPAQLAAAGFPALAQAATALAEADAGEDGAEPDAAEQVGAERVGVGLDRVGLDGHWLVLVDALIAGLDRLRTA